MQRPLILCFLLLGACRPHPHAPETSLPHPLDVSGDDCTASAFVYDRPPGDSVKGTPFINDGCFGERIFLGMDGTKRELTRAENVPLGTGGEYSDGKYHVQVIRGPLVRRVLDYRPPDAECSGDGESEYSATYAATVRIRSRDRSWLIAGTLLQTECLR